MRMDRVDARTSRTDRIDAKMAAKVKEDVSISRTSQSHQTHLGEVDGSGNHVDASTICTNK